MVMYITLCLSSLFGNKTGAFPLGLKSIFWDAMVSRVIGPTIINKEEQNQQIFEFLPEPDVCYVETMMCEA